MMIITQKDLGFIKCLCLFAANIIHAKNKI